MSQRICAPPVPPNPLLGRERDVAEVRARLQEPGVRLLTLTGPGGVGKTRLALAAAQTALGLLPAGVWLVPLASVADPARLPSTVATALALHEEPGRPLLATLTDHLRDKHLLLVLDNCEHLLDACADLVGALLGACPQLRQLATSRERLQVNGESVYGVLPLSFPDPHRPPPVDLLDGYEAVGLFVARARAQRPEFALTAHNARAVARVCARLDGLPLAIELAAARVNSLSVEAIAARLDERFRLLTGGPRDMAERQRTLRATMDWSWDLLEEEERALLRQLSVFAGGWTLQAAQAVGAGDDPDRGWAVLDLLEDLATKSLVGLDASGDEARYGLLETVRAYAAERLSDTGEGVAARDRHLDWCLALAEEAAPYLRGLEQASWMQRLEREHENLCAALAWAQQSGDGERMLRLAVALSWFWLMRGYLSEGLGWLEDALAAAGTAPAALRAAALNGAGNLLVERGEYGQAGARYEASLELRRELGDKRGIASSLTNLGVATDRQGAYGRAVALLEEALALARELGEAVLIARTLGNLGTVLGHLGQDAHEAARYEEALALFRALGDEHGIAVALDNLGLGSFRQGQYERAKALHAEALALFRLLGDQHGVAGTLINLGAVAEGQGELARAADLCAESLRLSRNIGAREQAVEGLELALLVTAAQGHARHAARLGGAATSLREVLSVPPRPDQRDRQAQAMQAIRSRLSEEDLAIAWAEGRLMDEEEAGTLALHGPVTVPESLFSE
jgi:predicted ATPase/Tfp pilus assembly protein PilF